MIEEALVTRGHLGDLGDLSDLRDFGDWSFAVALRCWYSSRAVKSRKE